MIAGLYCRCVTQLRVVDCHHQWKDEVDDRGADAETGGRKREMALDAVAEDQARVRGGRGSGARAEGFD